MDLSLDEQRLVAEFRKLSPTAQEELLTYASSLARKGESDCETAGQCRVKQPEKHPEAEKTPIFTE